MKTIHNLLVFATALLGTVSCSSNDVTERLNDQNEIRFASVQMGNNVITKATAMHTHSFGIYASVSLQGATGSDYFINKKLAWNGSQWGLDSKYYYPNGNFSMKFVGYGNTYGTNAPDEYKNGILKYNNWQIMTESAPGKGDWYQNPDICEAFVVTKKASSVSNISGKNGGINLLFTHALSKLQFNAKVVSPTNDYKTVSAKITSIKVKTPATGALSISETSKWAPASKMAEYSIPVKSDILTQTLTSVAKPFYVIPMNSSESGQRTITVNVEVVHNYGDGSPSNIVVAKATVNINPTADQLAMNNLVTYNLTVDLEKLNNSTGEGSLVDIQFNDPTIEEWNPVNIDNTTFPTVVSGR